MNVSGSVQYILTIENIKLEYMQNMIVFEQLTVEEEIDGKKIIERQAVRRDLEIAKDFYALTFCSFIQYYRVKYQITLEERV